MKNLLRFTLGGVVLTGTLALAIPESAQSFSVIGGNLSTSQRDFRIYDNFIDAASHGNTTADPNWPGYTEIELAVWKAGAEWGSEAFGDGSGDPLQTTVGSGGANFNFYWNGEAGGTGGFNGNINSPIAGSSGGVLAYTETPISDGWRIRYYESWTWDDGPGSVGSGRIDMQGVACHELGHALGLGHTNVNGATMYPTISGSGTAQRSIATDDQNGVQYIYGAKSSTLPDITSLSGNAGPGGTMVILGSNFSTTGNEVWFVKDEMAATQAGGDPYKVTGLSSTNGGTQISLTVPSTDILKGGIHVKKSGSGHSTLSQGEPFDYGGQVGNNSISLTGPNLAFKGTTIQYDYTGAPANSPAYLLWSLNQGPIQIMGHEFDIGSPWNIGAQGTSDASGAGSFTVTIPNNAGGLTVYIECGVDANPVIADSNMITLSIP